ncbi:MAG: hypothetical protein Q9161_003823 [Pseudevernia consocians]
MYKSRQNDNCPRSPVSPLESNGETWKYPRRAQAHLKGLGNLHEGSLVEAHKNHFRSRPISYYDGLPTSPEPEDKAVFADLPAAPATERLSRPFEQPYLMYNNGMTSGQGKASKPPGDNPMQANMTRADSHLRRQPAESSKRKAAPAPISVPKPAHQSRRQREPSPPQRDQPPVQRSGGHQGKKAPAQRTARHQGWNPLEEPPRQQRTARTHHQDLRRHQHHGDDLERQLDLGRSNNRSKHNDPQYKSGRRCFFFLLFMLILIVVIIVVLVEKNMHHG